MPKSCLWSLLSIRNYLKTNNLHLSEPCRDTRVILLGFSLSYSHGVLEPLNWLHLSVAVASYRVEQLIPHLGCAPTLRLHVDSLRGRHPLVGYCGRPPGGQELVSQSLICR